ncbi:MAG: hypothetical protein EOS63_04905 [Mesorhizobium sp.]|uniref:hypothetical protein n=1 Tax=Mesorhizobium sp. TaxID=1871066 RepID=UPI000FE72D72|nr:hypothetical protein [Mesorhizobium sp.]RWE83466.1 MAG: hypothetical protein EOS63_04905 [Mesorhizobium sp.]
MSPDQIKRRDWIATYLTREAALNLIDWLKADDWEISSVLDRRLPSIGIDWTTNFSVAAARCFEVYGYPELEAVAVARRVAEVWMRPARPAPQEGVAGGSAGLPQPSTPVAPTARPEAPQAMTYGFSPRR